MSELHDDPIENAIDVINSLSHTVSVHQDEIARLQKIIVRRDETVKELRDEVRESENREQAYYGQR